MAQPIVVAGATAESGAAVGPVRNHGSRSYSLLAGGVKVFRSKVNATGPILRKF
jgi:hypothetical protein